MLAVVYYIGKLNRSSDTPERLKTGFMGFGNRLGLNHHRRRTLAKDLENDFIGVDFS